MSEKIYGQFDLETIEKLADIDARFDVEVATADLVLPTVKAGLGVGFIPEFSAKEALSKGDIIKIDLIQEIPTRYICMVLPPRPSSIATKELIKIIRKQKEKYSL